MSARITLYCDQMWRDGSCTAQLITDARAIPEAREAADQLGWRTHPDGADYCPGHSGQPGGRPGTNVIRLHPDSP